MFAAALRQGNGFACVRGVCCVGDDMVFIHLSFVSLLTGDRMLMQSLPMTVVFVRSIVRDAFHEELSLLLIEYAMLCSVRRELVAQQDGGVGRLLLDFL